MRRRGFTLIESAMALAVTATLITSLTLLHAYILRNLGSASSTYSNYRQAQMLMDSIDEAASQAQSYSLITVNGTTCLKLIMPATCSDTDNDWLYDNCSPNRLSKRGIEEWGQGNRIWFYLGGSTGTASSSGKPWAALISGDSYPSSSTALSLFAKYSNGLYRFANVDTITFEATSTTSVTVTITASSNTGTLAEKKASTTQDNALTDSFTLNRRIFLARWRK